MTTANKQVMRDYIEQVVNTGNLPAMDRFVSADIIDHDNTSGSPQGIEAYKAHLAAVHHTYGQFHLTIEDQFSDGEYVITRITATGIHQNKWLGLSATRAKIILTGINIDRIQGGMITEH